MDIFGRVLCRTLERICDLCEASMDTFKQELALKPALNNTILGKLIERQALFQSCTRRT
jgi:hypothetical protein